MVNSLLVEWNTYITNNPNNKIRQIMELDFCNFDIAMITFKVFDILVGSPTAILYSCK